MIDKIAGILGKDAPELLEHRCRTIPKEQIHLPGPDFIDRIWADSDRKEGLSTPDEGRHRAA